jgi:hypothetical protein
MSNTSHCILYVADQERSTAFYSAVLGPRSSTSTTRRPILSIPAATFRRSRQMKTRMQPDREYANFCTTAVAISNRVHHWHREINGSMAKVMRGRQRPRRV